MPSMVEKVSEKERFPVYLLSPVAVIFFIAFLSLLAQYHVEQEKYQLNDADFSRERNSRYLQSLPQLLVCMDINQSFEALTEANQAVMDLQQHINNIQFHITHDPANHCSMRLYVRAPAFEDLGKIGQAHHENNTISISPKLYDEYYSLICPNNHTVYLHELLHLYLGNLDDYSFQDLKNRTHSTNKKDVLYPERNPENCETLSAYEIAYVEEAYLQAQLLQLLSQRILIPAHLIVR